MTASRRLMRWNGDLMNTRIPAAVRTYLHRIERLALQRVERRPVRLLRGEVVTASGGQRVGPPVPRGDEQQNGNEDRVRRKEQRDLAVGKRQHPRGSRRQIVASSRRPESGTPCRERTRVARQAGCQRGIASSPFALACRIASIIRAIRSAPSCARLRNGESTRKRREDAVPATVDEGEINDNSCRRCHTNFHPSVLVR